MNLSTNGITHVKPNAGDAYWQMGAALVTFKATSAETEGRYSLFEVEDEPGSGPPMHRHQREDEAYYILEGNYEIHYPGGTTLTLDPGAFVHVPRGTVHTYKCVGDSRGRMLVMASPAGMENFFAELGERAVDLDHPPVPTGPPRLRLGDRRRCQTRHRGNRPASVMRCSNISQPSRLSK
jgi:quercetin dioxygenase-like cupin family protein